MRKIFLQLLICVSFSAYSQDFWLQRDSVKGPPRSAASIFTIGDEGFIVGGLDQDGFKRKMYSYDLNQDDWDNELSLGGENGLGLNRGSATGFSIANKGYITLGQGDTNPFFNDTWEYDHETETWSQKANFIGESRRQAVAFTIDESAYVGTGIGQSGLLNDFYKYTPATNSWEQLNDFPGAPRKEASAFAINEFGFICAGDAGVYMNDLWRYLSEWDTWVQQTDFPGSPRKGAASWSSETRGFIATGEDNQFNYTNDVYEYNPDANTWTQRADFTGPARTNAIAFYVDGLAFLGTGYNGELLDDFYGYQPILNLNEIDDFISELEIYPIPILSSGTIKSNFEIQSVKITTITGRDVTSLCTISGHGLTRSIQKNKLSPGIYFIDVQGANKYQSITKSILFK